MHILWFCLLIPAILTGVLLSFPRLRVLTKWWEILIPFAVACIVILICQWIAVRDAVNDKEYWGHMSYQVVHEEPFAYDGECSETYVCGESCSGSGSNRICTPIYCTRYYHCIKDSWRRCYIVDDRNHEYNISHEKYNELAKRWENFNYTVKKIVTVDAQYTTIGDLYNRPNHGHRHRVYWPKDKWDVSEPLVVEHTYENRLQTQSHWGKVSEEDRKFYDVFEYPEVPGVLLTSILTNGPEFPKANKYLRYLNGDLNTDRMGYKKVRLWVLIFNNQPQSAGDYQRSYWKGGNKNEFIIMFGTNPENEITWFDIVTQSEEDILIPETRDEINLKMARGKDGYSGKLTDEDLLKFSQWLGEEIKTKYVKPQFEQYDYIEVYPSLRAIIITYLIVLVVTIGMGFFVVLNPWHDE